MPDAYDIFPFVLSLSLPGKKGGQPASQWVSHVSHSSAFSPPVASKQTWLHISNSQTQQLSLSIFHKQQHLLLTFLCHSLFINNNRRPSFLLLSFPFYLPSYTLLSSFLLPSSPLYPNHHKQQQSTQTPLPHRIIITTTPFLPPFAPTSYSD